ncbi:MAG: hypothetical protein ABSD99_07180 [Candidatus Bathyarchaeia archaeon]
MALRRLRGRTSVMVVIVLLIAVLVGGGLAWKWSAQDTSYVFSPCPGLTVTSTATTGIWNCPNEPALSAGQNVTMTGTWATGYETLGCVPVNASSPCMVPQIAILTHYLRTNMGVDNWFVIQWKQSETVEPTDGQTVTVSGTLQVITYPSNPGATYPIYHLNNETDGTNLLQPQPSFEITNAVLG